MKKLMIAAAALLMSASAMADWAVVEQTDDSYVFEESDLGIRMVAANLGASDGAPVDQIAAKLASEKGCQAPTEPAIAGHKGYHFVCPDAVQGIILDDDGNVTMIIGKCESEEQCASIDSLITKLSAK